MGPSGKSKSNKEAKLSSAIVRPALHTSALADAPASQQSPFQKDVGGSKDARYHDDKPHTAGGWYSGTWPRSSKANAVTKVATEKATAAGNSAYSATADSNAHVSSLSSAFKDAGTSLSRQATTFSGTLSIAAISKEPKADLNENAHRDGPKMANEMPAVQESVQTQDLEEQMKSNPDCEQLSVSQAPQLSSYGNTAGWSAWFGKVSKLRDGAVEHDVRAQGLQREGPRHTAILPEPDLSRTPGKRRNSEPKTLLSSANSEGQSKSWLASWIRLGPTNASDISNIKDVNNALDEDQLEQYQSANVFAETTQAAERVGHHAKPYGWAFWSRDSALSVVDEAGNGKSVLAGSSSQPTSEDATIGILGDVSRNISRRSRPHSMQASIDVSEPPNTRETESNPKHKISSIKAPAENLQNGLKESEKPKNLVLPSFKSTYHVAKRQGIMQQLSRMLPFGQSTRIKHVEISHPLRISKALAIGIHGYFPAPLIRSVLGQPTGTSIRFAHGAATAIRRWTQHLGYSCKVEELALEGEGKIAERVELLWKTLVNHMDQIRTADLIICASHSQAVPVAVMLMAKLITLECVSTARIGLCAMAGINLGPFAEYKSRWISGSAGELFDFANPGSQVSRDYKTALDVALQFGVRTVYVGSIDDQLVSLESSTFGILSHPYVYRAVFVDGRLHSPDFLTHLVAFALKVRNLGISDHSLIRELSGPLAGSLYTGEGHSRIYDEQSVYDLAVEFTLETTSIGPLPMQIKEVSASQTHGHNPYILPFAMRGVLEEEYVKTQLGNEISELVRQFDHWKPSSKVLKDVKFRLEGIRSKL